MPQQTSASAPPAPAQGATVTQSSAPVAPAVASGATPAEIYQAYRAQRRELVGQMETLEESRDDLVQQSRQGAISEADRAGIDQRLVLIDQQLAAKQIAIAEADAQVALAASVPGAAVTPRTPPRQQTSYDVLEFGVGVTALLFIPIVLAFARRIWRKSAVVISLPAELTERLGTIEQSIDAVAIEVERIGEGQRFVTQLMADRSKPADVLARGAHDPQI